MLFLPLPSVTLTPRHQPLHSGSRGGQEGLLSLPQRPAPLHDVWGGDAGEHHDLPLPPGVGPGSGVLCVHGVHHRGSAVGRLHRGSRYCFNYFLVLILCEFTNTLKLT